MQPNYFSVWNERDDIDLGEFDKILFSSVSRVHKSCARAFVSQKWQRVKMLIKKTKTLNDVDVINEPSIEYTQTHNDSGYFCTINDDAECR